MKYSKGATVRYAMKKSLPVFFGYLFLGSAFGIMLYEAGYNALWAAFISLLVYAGSGQFLLVSLIVTGASLPTTALMTLFVNSRHIFYGLSFVQKFRQGGWRYPFMIFTLTDETYSVNVSINDVPADVDEIKARFLIGEFNHLYWILGSVTGSLLGMSIPFDLTGIDFSMTALFVIIFIELLSDMNSRICGAVGVAVAVLCILIFGYDNFLLPALVTTVLLLFIMQPVLSRKEEAA